MNILRHIFRRKEQPTVHHLKILPDFFHDVVAGKKRFEVRRKDRPYKVGDILALKEWNAYEQKFTGNSCSGTITYILQGGVYGISKHYCVIGFRYRGVALNLAVQ